MGGTQMADCQRRFELNINSHGRPVAMGCNKAVGVPALAVIFFFFSLKEASAQRVDPCDVYADCSAAGDGGFLGNVALVLLALFVVYRFFNSKEFRAWTFAVFGVLFAMAYGVKEMKSTYGMEGVIIFLIIFVLVVQELVDRHSAKKESEKRSRQELGQKSDSTTNSVLIDQSQRTPRAIHDSKLETVSQDEVANAELRPRVNSILLAAKQAASEAEAAAKGVAAWKAKWGDDIAGATELAGNSKVQISPSDIQMDSYWVEVHAANEAKRLQDLNDKFAEEAANISTNFTHKIQSPPPPVKSSEKKWQLTGTGLKNTLTEEVIPHVHILRTLGSKPGFKVTKSDYEISWISDADLISTQNAGDEELLNPITNTKLNEIDTLLIEKILKESKIRKRPGLWAIALADTARGGDPMEVYVAMRLKELKKEQAQG